MPDRVLHRLSNQQEETVRQRLAHLPESVFSALPIGQAIMQKRPGDAEQEAKAVTRFVQASRRMSTNPPAPQISMGVITASRGLKP